MKCTLCNAVSFVGISEAEELCRLIQHIAGTHTTNAEKILEESMVAVQHRKDMSQWMIIVEGHLCEQIHKLELLREFAAKQNSVGFKQYWESLKPIEKEFVRYYCFPGGLIESWGL